MGLALHDAYQLATEAHGRLDAGDHGQATDLPSLSTSGETLTIEESMTLRARTENAGHVGDEHEWGWGSG